MSDLFRVFIYTAIANKHRITFFVIIKTLLSIGNKTRVINQTFLF